MVNPGSLLVCTFGIAASISTWLLWRCSQTKSIKKKNKATVNAQPIDHTYHLLDHSNQPTQTLKELLSLFDVHHDGSLESIIQETQKGWLRPPHTERWQLKERYARLYKQVLPLLGELGLITTVVPAKNHYTYALVLGGSIHNARSRLAYLVNAWRNGIRFDTLVFLTGARPLDKYYERPEHIFNTSIAAHSIIIPQPALSSPYTETDMIHSMFNQMPLPADMKNIEVVWVDTPAYRHEDGSLRRPTTAHTVEHWLSFKPKPGSCLAISNQPYLGYQDAVLRAHLPPRFSVETGGYASRQRVNIPTYLDTIARWLYQEKMRRKI